MKKKKVPAGGEGTGQHLAAVESELLRDLLPLVEHCCCTRYEDGDPREPGWFTVGTLGSAWRLQVKDPDSAMSFAILAPTIDEALKMAALHLGCDEAPWEPDQWLLKNKAKKKK